MPLTKRIFDLVFGGLVSILIAPLLALIALMLLLNSKGPVIYWSDRVGKKNKIFKMPKFRSMNIDTPELASHLLVDQHLYVTPFGSFLRKTSLDELPQLFCVLCGDMSLVGPRPALFNQYDLIQLRSERGVHNLVPGITGWAQINGRDELSIEEKVRLDTEYLFKNSLKFDLWIIFITIKKAILREDVNY